MNSSETDYEDTHTREYAHREISALSRIKSNLAVISERWGRASLADPFEMSRAVRDFRGIIVLFRI